MRNSPQPRFEGFKRTKLDEEAIALEKGRLIEGVESIPVLLKPLDPSEYRVAYKNNDITNEVGATAEDFIYMIDNSEGMKVAVMGRAPHWRNVSTPLDTAWTDEQGTPHYFFEVSTKGIGMVKSEVLEDYDYDTLKQENEYGTNINLGHANRDDFFWTEDLVAFTEKLNTVGIRSELYWEIAEVDKVSYNGELYDLADAKRQGIVHRSKENNPYIGVRLLKTNHRIEDYFKNTNPAEKREMLLATYDAFNKETKLTSRPLPELNIENPEHQKIYFETVLSQHIQNLARLVTHGLTYYHMHSSNLTLMGEIVDTAVVESININNTKLFKNLESEYDTSARTELYKGVRVGYLKDIRDCVTGVRFLLRGLQSDGYTVLSREEAHAKVMEVFKAAFSSDTFTVFDKETEVQKLLAVVEEISRRTLIGKETLPALKRNGIEAWGLQSL